MGPYYRDAEYREEQRHFAASPQRQPVTFWQRVAAIVVVALALALAMIVWRGVPAAGPDAELMSDQIDPAAVMAARSDSRYWIMRQQWLLKEWAQ